MRRVERIIAKMRKGKKPSRSTGTLSNGKLEDALELPVTEALGYRVSHPKRQTHFGADRMVFGLMTLGVRMRELCGEAGQFVVGDISAKGGGKLSPHINHQMGLDVDLGLYVTDPRGKPLGNRVHRPVTREKHQGPSSCLPDVVKGFFTETVEILRSVGRLGEVLGHVKGHLPGVVERRGQHPLPGRHGFGHDFLP